MESKHIALNPEQTVVLNSDELDIHVPAGTSRFVIRQKNDEPERTHIFHLDFPDSSVTVIGLVDATGDSQPALTTQVIHHAPHTKAETLVRTLSRDSAQPHYKGLIQIDPNSHDCESYLNHHSLLLGETAQSWTTPSLEILNNQVKCSHAATVRTITPLDLFYLQSRGLTAPEAETMLIDAFLSDVQA